MRKQAFDEYLEQVEVLSPETCEAVRGGNDLLYWIGWGLGKLFG